MPWLRMVIGSMGAAGAASNALAALHDRQREDWLVAGLARRVDRRDASRAHTAGSGSAPHSTTRPGRPARSRRIAAG